VSENLKLWQAVEKTDPKYTKAFSKAGGFSGTAINATYLLRKATEQWGPIGGTWGPIVEDEKYVGGADGTIIHVLRIRFRHPGGEFHAYGQTTFVGKNKNGAFTDEEAPKKSLTDAITKALAMLGFSADVFLGLYDDNKYVSDLKAEFKPKEEIKVDAEVITTLSQAAHKGSTAFREAWKALTAEQRKGVTPQAVASLKAICDEADADLATQA
jgi:hypothetical protein